MTRRKLGWLILAPEVAIIALVTLVPDGNSALLAHWCFRCGAFWLTDFVLNGVLFIPLGAALYLVTGSILSATVLAGATSLWIEVLQAFLVVGRVASTGDIFSNSAGALLGALIACFAIRLVRPGPWLARRLALAAAASWLALIAALSAAMEKSLGERDIWGQWAPDLGHLEHFRGNILNGTLDGGPFPWSRSEDSYRLRAELLSDEVAITATVIPSLPTVHLAPILSMFDAGYSEILLLGQRAGDAVFRVRTRAADVGLLVPEAVLRDVFPGWFGESAISVAVIMRGNSITLTGVRAGEREARISRMTLGPHIGWMLLIPGSRLPGVLGALVTATWLGALLFPAAFWARASGMRPAPLALSSAGVLLVGFVVVPSLMHVAPAPAAVWLGTGLLVWWGVSLAGSAALRGAGITAGGVAQPEALEER